MTWRELAAPLIAKVIAETERTDPQLLKQRLRDAYPWGERARWPYTVWRDEIKRQRGLKPPLKHGGRKPEQVPEEQGRLFP